MPSTEALASIAYCGCVENIFIFWNEPSPDVRKSLAELAVNFPTLSISFSAENLGSAGGYARLLEKFRDSGDAPYLLLLDDDLRLAPDCIETLVAAAQSHSDSLDTCLFLAHRPQLPELENLVKKHQGIMKPRAGCCVGFHFLNLLSPLRESLRYSTDTGFFNIDSAPWGGLFIPRRALQKLGMPREDFFLYAEDSELTYRFTGNQGKILLVPKAVITDTDKAWNTVGGNISNLRRRVLWLPEMKVFHEVRNRNYMARHYYPGFLPVYWINKYLFLASAYFIGITNGKFSRALLIHQAIHAGEKMAANEARHQ